MERYELERMNIDALRKMVRDHAELGERALRGAIVLSLSKEQLIGYIAGEYDLGEKEPAPAPAPAPKPAPAPAGLEAIIAAAVAPFVQARGVDENAVNALIDAKLKDAIKTKTIEVKRFDGTTKNLGVQHCQFETILKLAALRMNIMLVGPAGSGKTTVCANAAKALDLPFRFISVGMQTTKSDLLGYTDAQGRYVTTHLRETYEKGGVFLLDEVDAGNPNVLTVINAALSNGHAAFPDKIVEKHPDFICICAANTYGRGADRLYVGRNQLDAATLDRFAVISFEYDEALEMALAGNAEWTKKIQELRAAASELRERVVISPRASIEGAKLLAAGFSEMDVFEMIVWKGIANDIRQKIASKAMQYREAA